MDNEVVCIIPQSLFDHLAEKDAERAARYAA